MSEHVYCVAIAFKMTEQVEQQICIKFCVKLELSFAKTIQMIQEAFRDVAMNAMQIKVWHKHFKDDKNLLKVVHVLEGLQLAEHLRMLKVYRLQPTKISD